MAARTGARLRRGSRPEADGVEAAREAERSSLPVPIDAPHPPPQVEPPPAAAAFDAQLLGQDGQKRGLRGGPAVIDRAQVSYNRVEWSGERDRRAPKGRNAKTEI